MTAEDPVVVADPALLACMNEWLQQPATATISPAQVIKIRATLECSRMGIQTLEGAQRLQFVSAFVLSHNQISALQPLSCLHNLLSLYLDHNRICDLRPLAGIPDLVELHLQGQQCEYRLPPGPVTLDNPVFAPDGMAYELAYGKGLTPFLRLAANAGVARIADGLGMLVEQAAEAFHWWRGLRPATGEVIARLTVPLK